VDAATEIPIDNQDAEIGQEDPAPPDDATTGPQPAGPDPDPSAQGPDEDAELRRIKDLPKEVGVMLMTVGALGFVLPGVVGTPAIIAGGLVLWPRRFARVESWFEQRFPDLHKRSLAQISRYLDDLDSRYPPSA
jgi:hypothetical protein